MSIYDMYMNESSKPMTSIDDTEPKKHTREALMRYMNKDKKRSYTKKTNFTYEEIAKSLIILMDNGIDPDNACGVLTAIGHSLLDIEIFKNIDQYILGDTITTLRSNRKE